MSLVSALVGALALTSVPTALAHGYTKCESAEVPTNFKLASAKIQQPINLLAAASTNVKVYAHVVTTSAKQGRYSQQQVNKQISVMNARYKKSGIKFKLAGTDFTVNNNWAQSQPQDTAMKFALHKGTYADLNLYFVSDLKDTQGGNGLLGFCPFPYTDIDPNNSTYTPYINYDGCLIAGDSLPGGAAFPYDLGITAVHEVGHWFGLYHVFQGDSCSGPGDYVADTPKQSTASFGCPKNKDTCPGGGKDSIHNYMDYTDDRCLDTFSPDQSDRATAIYYYYRRCDGVCPNAPS